MCLARRWGGRKTFVAREEEKGLDFFFFFLKKLCGWSWGGWMDLHGMDMRTMFCYRLGGGVCIYISLSRCSNMAIIFELSLHLCLKHRHGPAGCEVPKVTTTFKHIYDLYI